MGLTTRREALHQQRIENLYDNTVTAAIVVGNLVKKCWDSNVIKRALFLLEQKTQHPKFAQGITFMFYKQRNLFFERYSKFL